MKMLSRTGEFIKRLKKRNKAVCNIPSVADLIDKCHPFCVACSLRSEYLLYPRTEWNKIRDDHQFCCYKPDRKYAVCSERRAQWKRSLTSIIEWMVASFRMISNRAILAEVERVVFICMASGTRYPFTPKNKQLWAVIRDRSFERFHHIHSVQFMDI